MVQSSVSKFVRERHLVPTNANFSVITNAPFARDRYDAVENSVFASKSASSESSTTIKASFFRPHKMDMIETKTAQNVDETAARKTKICFGPLCNSEDFCISTCARGGGGGGGGGRRGRRRRRRRRRRGGGRARARSSSSSSGRGGRAGAAATRL